MIIFNGIIIQVRTSSLPNDIQFEFHVENISIFHKFGTDALGIQEYMEPFINALKNEQIALEHIVKSEETEPIAVADILFDYSFASMRDYVNSCLKQYNEGIYFSAKKIQAIFEKYGNIALLPYRQQLSASLNLTDELNKHSEDIRTIDLTPQMKTYEIARKELIVLLNKRTDEIAQRTDFRAKETRRQVDLIYLQILDRLESMINLHGKDFVPGFVSKYNAHATEYNNKYTQYIKYIQAKKNKYKEDKNKPTDNDEN
jgi:hypothetical protein